jgi:predicted transcriptional regulator
VEGDNAEMVRARTLAREDAPTCGLEERLGDVKERVENAGWDTCVVVNERRIVLGLLRPKHLQGDPDQTAEQAMSPGPSTFRPHVSAAELGEYMVRHDMPTVPITTGDGELVGVLRREDAARAADEHHGHEEHDDGS